jgi:hypothetical protein
MPEILKEYDLRGVQGAEIFRDLTPGLKLLLDDGAIGSIVINPADGCYIVLDFTDSPAEAGRSGEEEIVYFEEVVGVVA